MTSPAVITGKGVASTLSIRRWISAERLDDIMAMIHAAFGAFVPPSSVLTETVADLAKRQRDGIVLVAQEGERFVGSVFCGRKDDALYVTRLAVLPAWRRRGIGAALMAAAEGEARTLGLVKLTLRVRKMHPGNLAYYKKLGFAVTGEGQEGSRSPFYVMERAL